MSRTASAVVRSGGAIAAALVFVLPFAWMALTSLRTGADVYRFPPSLWLPAPHWATYAEAWRAAPFGRYLVNSVVVTGAILVLQLVSASLAAYALACLAFPGRGVFFGMTIGALFVPPQLTFLPVFLGFRTVGLHNTYGALILPYAASAFGTFLLRQSFKQVPGALLEAARLDGAGHLRVLWHVLLPASRAALLTFALFSIVYHWNDYFWPLVMTNTEGMRTLPVGLAYLNDPEGGKNWPLLMAANVCIALPVLALFAATQRYIVQGFVYRDLR